MTYVRIGGSSFSNEDILESNLKKVLENGERKKLRSFHADTIFIAVGDEGILEYRGITIQAFHPLTAKK